MTMRALLVKSDKSVMEVRTLAIEVFKIISNINPNFMEDIFIPRSNASYRTRKHTDIESFSSSYDIDYYQW